MILCVSKESAPSRKPFRYVPVELQWRQGHSPKAALAVDEDALVVAQVAELVGFDFVFFGFRVVDVALTGA